MKSLLPRPGRARRAALMLLPIALSACAVQRPAPQAEAPLPARWHAPLPHHGDVADLTRWWERQSDPLLVAMIAAAQEASADIAQARARLAQARAAQVAARSALMPALNGQASASRGFHEQVGALAGTAQAGLQASWEIDLFGGNSASRDAARERLAAAGAQWHEARVSVAAEVALQLTGWRSCAQQLAVAQSDAQSRGETARLSQASEKAGFTAPATAALASASYSDAKVRTEHQRMQCEINLKTLVALTGLEESALRARLATAEPVTPPEALFAIGAVPAQALAQRPDVYAAEREVAASSAEVGAARSERYPRLSLTGTVGRGWLRTGGASLSSNTWSLGPVALSLPIFDAGRRAAQEDAAVARYDAAVLVYRAQVRRAVSEVEQALVQLASTDTRSADASQAAAGYRRSFDATEARWRAGLAGLMELEDARRTSLAAQTALVALQQERMAAWIALYRAVGGGWDAQQIASTLQPAGAR